MKWRFTESVFDKSHSSWSYRVLPRRHYCKNCYRSEVVYYISDNVIDKSGKSIIPLNSRAMMVCSLCGYHLQPIETSFKENETVALKSPLRPTKWHLSGVSSWDGEYWRKELVIPYEFRDGHAIYPDQKVLLRDITHSFKMTGVLSDVIINRLVSKEDVTEEMLQDIYRRSIELRKYIDHILFDHQ